MSLSVLTSPTTRNPSIWVHGGVSLQGWNLKELTEWHHKVWSMRLNLTQHGERYQNSTFEWWTDCRLFLDSMDSGAWPFLVGGVICLVDSDNERDLHLSIACVLVFCRVSTCNGLCVFCEPFSLDDGPKSEVCGKRKERASWAWEDVMLLIRVEHFVCSSVHIRESTAGLWCPQMLWAARARQWRTKHVLIWLCDGGLKKQPFERGGNVFEPSQGCQTWKSESGNLSRVRRTWNRLLKLFAFNEEYLVNASPQLAPIVSLPFVHTARRCYRW